MFGHRISVSVVCLVTSFAGALAPMPPAAADEVVLLDQGWTPDERLQFYFTTQGSQLIPYSWFLALEQVDGNQLFRAADHMERLGFISHAVDPQRNPDGLPIGFVKDELRPAMDYTVKESFLGAHYDRQQLAANDSWLGLTCAACHTSQLQHAGKTIRIDGGSTLADVQRFLQQLTAAVEATIDDPPKLTRFAKRVLPEGGYNETEQAALRERLQGYVKVLQDTVRRGAGSTPAGFGRLDAFGSILNEICETSLQLPENHHPADAPVSVPFLWDTPRLDWVQWNGSAGDPLARNVGEVLGVFAQLRLTPDPSTDRFRSTAHIPNIHELEQHVAQLQAPKWPQEFGEIDVHKARIGKHLFVKNCAVCHGIPDAETGQYPMTPIAGKEYIKTALIPATEIGTDPKHVNNFTMVTAKPGVLADRLPPPLAGQERVPRAVLLTIAVKGVINKYVSDEGLSSDQAELLRGNRPEDERPPKPAAYKARPLNGIWATAPFLHNGSVPNLYELLLPAERRSKSFFIGHQEYDTQRVGFVTEQRPGSFEFKVTDACGTIAGNSNAGHTGHFAGTNMGFTHTYVDGGWREFTEEERWALVEYMKCLGDPAALADDDTSDPSAPQVEKVPSGEAAQIQEIIAATLQQLKNRYPHQQQVIRGVHTKDHGCVQATFEVVEDLDERYRVGVFAEPGRRYDAWIRFSNAATLVSPDDPPGSSGKPTPGSRGMAIKLMGVAGTPLLPPHGALTQDFLLVNHPVFPFANVEDYHVLSNVLADPANHERPDPFFQIQFAKGGAAAARAKATLEIVGKIRAATVAEGAYQAQPISPVDCSYFSGAPFLFGDQHVMKYAAVPAAPCTTGTPNVSDPNYLRTALIARLSSERAEPVVFHFQVQRRAIADLDIANDIESVQTLWSEEEHPFVTVAKITIAPQDFDSPPARQRCEDLIFTPWHGVQEHRPVGGINRLRRGVYEASASFRHLPKEPAGHSDYGR